MMRRVWTAAIGLGFCVASMKAALAVETVQPVEPSSSSPAESSSATVMKPIIPLDPHFPMTDEPPAALREFRAAWVATVANIDWPSRPGLSTWEQQAEIIAILNRAVELRLNALIVQIRTTADALYDSRLEPWSEYLSGRQGEPPFPYYDPLKFWISEGHKRGLEIHAWFNPYRAKFARSTAERSPTHLSRAHPEMVKEYGAYLWLDPGEPAAAEHSFKVFMDVVERYDIDGIHIDDYFYPYPIKNPDGSGGELDFPDDPSWQRYQEEGGQLTRPDWRRANVNGLIERIYQGIKQRKKRVKFGISPFGLGRPGTAPGIKGFDQYEKLYADAALWLREGWCDYYTPQLYWPVEQLGQEFPVLLDYWIGENRRDRHVWPGLFTSRVIAGRRKWGPETLLAQIAVTQARGAASDGHVHFSMKALMLPADGLTETLRQQTYAMEALIPATPWLDDTLPAAPEVKLVRRGERRRLRLRAKADDHFLWGVWTLDDVGWLFDVVPGRESSVPLEDGVRCAVVTSVDRTGNESARVSPEVR